MKEIFSVIAVILTFIGYIPYYRDILRGKTRPHIYSWSLWSLITILIIALQITGGAGSAIWVTIAAGLFCLGVVILSFRNGKREITKLDTMVASLALIAVLCWLIIDEPIISMIFVIAADMLAFIPAIRKSWIDPRSETLALYAITTVRFLFALAAIESYTFLSAAWGTAWLIANGSFSLMLVIRRRQLQQSLSS